MSCCMNHYKLATSTNLDDPQDYGTTGPRNPLPCSIKKSSWFTNFVTTKHSESALPKPKCWQSNKLIPAVTKYYLVNQRRPLVQLDDDLAVFISTSSCTKLYRYLNREGFELYLDSNLWKLINRQYQPQHPATILQ